jgi:c-di-GMP-related signal transduction protein
LFKTVDSSLFKELGCDLFQGFFYCRQEIYTNKEVSTDNLTYLRLIQKVNQDTIDFKEISYIISRDVTLSYKLLRLVNSVAFGFREKIRSIKHALVIIGENELRKWVSLIALRGIGDDRPEELTRTILIRARFLELLSHKTGLRYRSSDMFLLGLFSMLDVFMGRPIKELLNGLPISYDIINALLYKEGPLFDPYRLAISCERGRFSDVLDISALLGIDVPSLLEIYLLALEWYESITLSKNV